MPQQGNGGNDSKGSSHGLAWKDVVQFALPLLGLCITWIVNNTHSNYVPTAGVRLRSNLLQCGQVGTLIEYSVVNTSTFPLESWCKLEVFLSEPYDPERSQFTGLTYQKVGAANLEFVPDNGGTKIVVSAQSGSDQVAVSPGQYFGILLTNSSEKNWKPREVTQVCSHGYIQNVTEKVIDNNIQGPSVWEYLFVGIFFGFLINALIQWILRRFWSAGESVLAKSIEEFGKGIGVAILEAVNAQRLNASVDRETEALAGYEGMPSVPNETPPADPILKAAPRRGKGRRRTNGT